MPKVIEFQLSADSIDRAVRELEAASRQVRSMDDALSMSLCSYGMDQAAEAVANMAFRDEHTGELAESFYVRQGQKGSCEVVNDSDHAHFVEFGTGVRGERSPYQYQFPAGVSWQYNTRGVTTDKDDWGWRYTDGLGGTHWTKGMPSRPFMAPAAELMRQREVKAAREVLGW